MTKFRAVILLALICSCATLSSNPGFVAFGACTTQNLMDTGRTLINDLSSVFAQASYEAEVIKLIAKSGYAQVQCAIDLYIAEMNSKKSLTAEGNTSLANAKAYRAAHPVQ